MNLEFFVANRKLTAKGSSALAADTAACDTFSVEFDREWDGLVKMVELKNGKNVVQVLYTGKTPLPRQVCGRGALYLTCRGYRQKGDAVAVVRTLPMVRPVLLVGSVPAAETVPQPEAVSIYAQMAASVERAEKAAETAAETAKRLITMQEQGLLQGEKGEAATVSVGQVGTCAPGEAARVYATGTRQNVTLHFVLPRGRDGQWTQEIRDELVQAVLQALPDLDEVSY